MVHNLCKSIKQAQRGNGTGRGLEGAAIELIKEEVRGGNPKSEIRDPKEIRNPKSERGAAPPELGNPIITGASLWNERTLLAGFRGALHDIRISGLGFLSDFGFRISDFPPPSPISSLYSMAVELGGRVPLGGCEGITPRPRGASFMQMQKNVLILGSIGFKMLLDIETSSALAT